MERTIHDNRITQTGSVPALEHRVDAHYENLKPHVPSPEDWWCVPQNMEGLEYLIVERACEVNEKGTRESNNDNENTSMGDKKR